MQKAVDSIHSYVISQLNDKERARLKAFKKHSDDELKDMMNRGVNPAIGGILTYLITPTSLGEVYKLRCACGKEEDITDYSCW